MVEIEEAVQASIPFPTICVRKANTIAIHSELPQVDTSNTWWLIIIKVNSHFAPCRSSCGSMNPQRKYWPDLTSIRPARHTMVSEISFFLFISNKLVQGYRVWVNPRCLSACIRQCNTIDITRRSPSYEIRLSKYSNRGFEIYLPTLRRDQVNLSSPVCPSPPSAISRAYNFYLDIYQ